MIDQFRVRYDKDADVLYITTPEYGPASGEEDQPGVYWRYLNSDGTLVGVTVLDYTSYWKPRFKNLVEQFSEHFHVPRQAAARVLSSVQ